jgi:Na+/proline symporter
MFGAIAVAVVAVKKVGGLDKLLTNEKVMSKLSIFPDFSDINLLMAVFIIPLAVQWWAAWYPGAEPGGGGYIVQRMIAAKDEKNSIGATLLFNIVHYAVSPWPWILVALASIIVFPDLQSISNAFSNIPADKLGHDLAYPAMISFLPHGLLGIVVASLTAAFMSTISTHLNWGSSYIVNDFYKRFLNKDANEKQMVRVGRISTLLLMIASGIFALYLQNAFQAFKILLQIGAGTGLLFILRWFWWRINAISEITAMVVSFFVAIYFELIHTRLGFEKFEDWQKFSLGVLITTLSWITATLLTKPSDKSVLIKFYKLINPSGPGWKNFAEKENIVQNKTDNGLANSLLSVYLGSICVYATLFSIGYWIYSNYNLGIITSIIAIVSAYALWKNINGKKITK